MDNDSNTQNNMQICRLVQLAKAKDTNAFAKLYEMVYIDMYKMAFYTLGSRTDAEDIVSETVLDAYTSIHKLRDNNAFKGWIFRILSNKCKRRIKFYQSERYEKGEFFEEAISDASLYDMDSIIEKHDILNAFNTLSPEERLIVSMIIYSGYTSKETARILNKNHNTVRSKYRRSLDKLRQKLDVPNI